MQFGTRKNDPDNRMFQLRESQLNRANCKKCHCDVIMPHCKLLFHDQYAEPRIAMYEAWNSVTANERTLPNSSHGHLQEQIEMPPQPFWQSVGQGDQSNSQDHKISFSWSGITQFILLKVFLTCVCKTLASERLDNENNITNASRLTYTRITWQGHSETL